ncbi:MAG: M1 family metallopeptidase [Chloroflexi bacterium]|nr:M1 family metallopeptidase [Chloroflexota bacterium]
MKQKILVIGLLFSILLSCRTVSSTSTMNSEDSNTTQLTPTQSHVPPLSQPEVAASSQPGGEIVWQEIPPSELFDLDWENNSLFLKGLRPKSRHWVADLPYASRYRMELIIPDEVEGLSGRQEVVYTNQEDVDLNEIIFRLFANVNGGAIEVSNLRVNGKPVDPRLINENSTLAVSLNEPLAPGESILIQMDFALQIPLEMGGNYGLFGYFSDVLMLDVFSPMIPAYDDQGWYSETPSKNGDLSYNDASFYLVRVIAPDDFVLVTSGVEVDRETDNGTQMVTYAVGPARDFSLVGSRNFIVDSDEENGVTVNSYGLPGMEEGMELAKESALAAIRIFDGRIGAYDYTEFDVVSTPMLAGGIEYPGMTWINMNSYDLSATIKGIPASSMLESVTAHETGHQWFYNAVGNDQSDMPWLDESLVQYITGLYFLDRYGTEGYEGYKSSWDSRWKKVDYQEMPIGLPSSAYNETEYSAVVYGRGPYFFEKLSDVMGEDAFGEFLRDYYNRYHWQIAETEDLKRVAEQYCGCDLTGLFEDWVYQ